MPKTVSSPLQKKLAAMLVEQRKKAGLRQVDLAKKIGVYQSWSRTWNPANVASTWWN
jgi:ribosome-binding protein aMBF1 (putative translation factor)